MELNQMNAPGRLSFRLCDPLAKALTGLAAALAIGGFGALVFGPLADDQRALDLATLNAVSASGLPGAGLRAAAAVQEAASEVSAPPPGKLSGEGRTANESFAVASGGAFAGSR